MSITKRQLKEIAAKAWAEIYENAPWEDYEIKIRIDGDESIILPILQEFADDLNDRLENLYCTCVVESDNGTYTFGLLENMELPSPSFEVNENEKEDEIVAKVVEVLRKI